MRSPCRVWLRRVRYGVKALLVRANSGGSTKAYPAPTLVSTGNAVRDTLNGSPNLAPESMFARPKTAGCVGYYL